MARLDVIDHIADTILTIGQTISDTPDPSQYGTFHYVGYGACSWADIAALIFKIYGARTGCKIELNRITTSEYPTPARRPSNSCLNTDKVEQAFGVQPRAWAIGVEQIVNRLIDEGL